MGIHAKFIKPVVIEGSSFVSSTVPEPTTGETAWVSMTSYVVGNEVIRSTTHKIYRCTANVTSSTPPENDTTNWLDIGFVNRWRMFDDKIGTFTSSNSSPITVVVKPGNTTAIALLELKGTSVRVRMKDVSGGSTVYDKTVDLDETYVNDFYDWFFNPYEQRTDLVLTDLPGTYPNCEIQIDLTGTGELRIGVCKMGIAEVIGYTQYGATVGIKDFSRKEEDAFGNTILVERGFKKKNNYRIYTEKSMFNRIYNKLAQVRATPCIYIGVDETGFEPMIVYGFYRDFSIDVSFATQHVCSLDLEGLL